MSLDYMHKKYCVYKITTHSGYVYIGISSNLKQRMESREMAIKRNIKDCSFVSGNKILSNEAFKYGLSSFNISILHCSLPRYLAMAEEKRIIADCIKVGASLANDIKHTFKF